MSLSISKLDAEILKIAGEPTSSSEWDLNEDLAFEAPKIQDTQNSHRTRGSHSVAKVREDKTSKVSLPPNFSKLTYLEEKSSNTFHFYNNTPPKFVLESCSVHVNAYDGLEYKKKGESEYRYILRGMECDVTHKVSFKLF